MLVEYEVYDHYALISTINMTVAESQSGEQPELPTSHLKPLPQPHTNNDT